eukprot:CAMPEP_0182539960 /NCGR_PEP_ID=MMETSP1323-20130603/26268_1 /TAXON_ID=236787 /ORGANISM="Florenciella parvula, Strain RCC1693" /LENGTH=66 /DNA_ID=CAMNT_0024750573 /DNA_START=273 /DNA_END=473 /DNA_ORIENTATION=+
MALMSNGHARHLAVTQFKSPWRLAEYGDLNGLQAMARTSPTVQLDLRLVGGDCGQRRRAAASHPTV